MSSLLVPTVLENTPRGERAYDLFSRLLRDRIIVVNGPIDDTMSGLVVAQLLYLAAEDSKREINMYINSPGGSINAGLGIYDTMRVLPCPISTDWEAAREEAGSGCRRAQHSDHFLSHDAHG